MADRMTNRTLQDRVADWHERRFPFSVPAGIALKATEELGEVAQDVLADWFPDGVLDPGDVPGEAADVVICLMALIGRFYTGSDLLDEVEKKLAKLNDPNSGHRSAVLR